VPSLCGVLERRGPLARWGNAGPSPAILTVPKVEAPVTPSPGLLLRARSWTPRRAPAFWPTSKPRYLRRRGFFCVAHGSVRNALFVAFSDAPRTLSPPLRPTQISLAKNVAASGNARRNSRDHRRWWIGNTIPRVWEVCCLKIQTCSLGCQSRRPGARGSSDPASQCNIGAGRHL